MNIVFVGAGGSGVSALVHLMYTLQIPNLICIDANNSPTMEEFGEWGLSTYIGHGKYEVKANDLVIYSAATATTAEVVGAFEHTLKDPRCTPPMLYAEFLGELSKYLFTVAVSGTHGKSTTSGMLAVACTHHLPQTALAIVGAGVTERGGKHCRHNTTHKTQLHNIVLRIISRKATTIQIPQKKLVFVIEADEFNHHFLFLEPDVSIITSLDHDHVDIYPTRESYLTAFEQFCKNTTHCIVTLPSIAEQLSIQKEKVELPDRQFFTFTHLVGGHNHSNASLALCACVLTTDLFHQKISKLNIKESIEGFQGLKRRVELLGTNTKNIPVFSDYGHHPDEIKSTLQAFREKRPHTQITCLFEAHQARRLVTFWKEFVTAFEGISCVVVPAYTARENIAEIQEYMQQLPQPIKNLHTLVSFSQLTSVFCNAIGGTLLEDRNKLQDTVNNISLGSVLCFSAGVLDSKLRACMTK